jgi:hypothetical protein
MSAWDTLLWRGHVHRHSRYLDTLSLDLDLRRKMKTLLLSISLLAVSFADAAEKVVYGVATLTIPERFTLVKKEHGDCPGLSVFVRDNKLAREFELRLGDDFLPIRTSLDTTDLEDLEHFEREPGSWVGYQLVVLRRGDKRVIQMRRPVMRAFFSVTVPANVDFRPILESMKAIDVQLTAGTRFIPSADGRTYSLYPPGWGQKGSAALSTTAEESKPEKKENEPQPETKETPR